MALIALTRMTVSDSLRQPLTYIMTGLSLALLGLSYGFGLFNFETQDRIRMLATAGVAVSVVNGLFLAVTGASMSIHDELNSRTALTLFAKPLTRAQFLVGKAAGIWLTVVVSSVLVALGHAAVMALALHTGFEDSHGHGGDVPLWVPWQALSCAHALALAHAAILVCLATVLALRISLIANILTCFAVFVLGHLLAHTPAAAVIPALALFNIDDTIQLSNQSCSAIYLGLSGLYAVSYSSGILLIGLALFKRQDIP
jgi:ABC-type transport system involved in multi-copper enzyme maturation permease subunit